MRLATHFHQVVCLLLPTLIASSWGLTFTQPAAGTTFSSTLPNTIAFTATTADPSLIDLYLSSTSSAFGSTHLRLLATSVSSGSGSLTFTAGGIAVLPPGDGYTVVAVPRGQRKSLATSRSFKVVAGTPPNEAATSPKPATTNNPVSVSSPSNPTPATSQSVSTNFSASPSSPYSSPSSASSPSSVSPPPTTRAGSSTSTRFAAVTAAADPGGTSEQGLGDTSGASMPGAVLGATLLGCVWAARVAFGWL